MQWRKKRSSVTFKCQHSNMLVTKHGAWLNFMLPWTTNNLQSYQAPRLILLLNWQSFDAGIYQLACWKKKKSLHYRIILLLFLLHLSKTIKWCKKLLLLDWEFYGIHYIRNFFIAGLIFEDALYIIENSIILVYLWVGLKQLILLNQPTKHGLWRKMPPYQYYKHNSLKSCWPTLQ